jgi:hypothetical protein
MEYCRVVLELGACLSIPRGRERAVHFEQQALGGGPVDARISNRHSVLELAQILGNRLATSLQMALEHQAHD